MLSGHKSPLGGGKVQPVSSTLIWGQVGK
ncbi:protein of unknown function [Cyanobium sp. NIES-981]|nr:protein of unknown function [Cyanobium sp. NIES-981]